MQDLIIHYALPMKKYIEPPSSLFYLSFLYLKIIHTNMSSSPIEHDTFVASIESDFDDDFPVDDPEMAFEDFEEWKPLEFVEDEEISFAEFDNAPLRYPSSNAAYVAKKTEFTLTEDDSYPDMRPHALFTNSTAQPGTYRANGLCNHYMANPQTNKTCRQRACRGKTPTHTHDFASISRCNNKCNTTRMMCGLWHGETCEKRHDGETLDEYILRRQPIVFKTPRNLDIQVVSYPDNDEMRLILVAAKQCNASAVNITAKRYQL